MSLSNLINAVDTKGQALAADVNATAKDMVYLAKAVEAMTIPDTVAAIQDEGAAQILAVENAAAATVANINNVVSNVIGAAPDGLNTLEELAAAINDDTDYAATVTTALGNRVVKDAPVLGGNLDGAGYTYSDFHPEVSTATVTTTQVIDVNSPMHHFTMSAGTAFSGINLAAGKTCMMMLDTSASAFTPTWSSDIKFPAEEEPTWADYRYWMVSLTCLDATTMFMSAQGYTV
jgi:hypothetical protein